MRPVEIGGGGAGGGGGTCTVTCIVGTACMPTCVATPCFPTCNWCSTRCSNVPSWCTWHSPNWTYYPALELGTTTPCGGSHAVATIAQQPTELTRESIAALKEQLQQQIAKLDEHAKTLDRKK